MRVHYCLKFDEFTINRAMKIFNINWNLKTLNKFYILIFHLMILNFNSI